ncbi:hypothetical protein QYH69_08190 [Paraburkholderia sp. SARCC-3016]|uniref:hypothetical protein n=1 Tax=Paraburkholderia sp. SARCC-3016 TaxID=3058611 RepID=UPI002806FAB9|nr:hypothetical protein [Paraburkholderia sp. SARCC-3016]MDQ7977224.1 hypothetical protein [Paraburkholderia sp. SARCC-3016]
MCIQAIAKALTGDVGGAVKAEANAWGLGGASASSSFCGTGSASAHGCGSYRESHGSHGCGSGLRSHWDGHNGGHSRSDGSFEKTTTQTHVGPDGSITRKTTQISHSGTSGGDYRRSGYDASGYDHFGANRSERAYQAGYNEGRFGGGFESSGARDLGNQQHVSMQWRSDPAGGYTASGVSAGSASFAMAQASIAPTGLLGGLLNLFGGGNPQAA